jgi:hypothetical protein
MNDLKTALVVRKHITANGTEVRYEDYPNIFGTYEEALMFLKGKQQKYLQTLNEFAEDGINPADIPEGRRYEIVQISISG